MADTRNRNRHQAGAPASQGGRFAAENRGEAAGSLTATMTPGDTLLANLIESLKPWETDLVFVNYDDQLTHEQIDQYLSGDEESLNDSLDEWTSDARYERAVEIAKEHSGALGIDWDDLDPADQDAARSAIYDRDTSDPAAALARNTPKALLRAPLDSVSDVASDLGIDTDSFFIPQLWTGRTFDVAEGRRRILNQILGQHGVNTAAPGVAEAVAELLSEGPDTWHEGVTLDVIWYGDIADATVIGPQGAAPAEITFTKPHIVLLDPMNGSGHDVELPDMLIKHVTPSDPAHLDSASHRHGYGWDDTAGVYMPAYAPENVSVVRSAPVVTEVA